MLHCTDGGEPLPDGVSWDADPSASSSSDADDESSLLLFDEPPAAIPLTAGGKKD